MTTEHATYNVYRFNLSSAAREEVIETFTTPEPAVALVDEINSLREKLRLMGAMFTGHYEFRVQVLTNVNDGTGSSFLGRRDVRDLDIEEWRKEQKEKEKTKELPVGMDEVKKHVLALAAAALDSMAPPTVDSEEESDQ